MTAVVAEHAPPARRIPVNGHKIRFRFAQQAAWTFILTLLVVAAGAAGYYLLTQRGIFFPKANWDNLFTQSWWPAYRHGIRNVGEGVAAKFVVETFIAKWQKHPDVRLPGRQMSLRTPLLLIESLVLIIAGIFVVSYGLPDIWHHFLHHHHVTAISVGGGASSLFAGFNWPDFIVGFVAAHVLRGQWRPVGNTINLSFIEQQVDRIRQERSMRALTARNPDQMRAATGWLPRWMKLPVLPPTVRERVSWMLDNHVPCKRHGPWPSRLAVTIGVLSLGLSGYGEYILHVVAKGK